MLIEKPGAPYLITSAEVFPIKSSIILYFFQRYRNDLHNPFNPYKYCNLKGPFISLSNFDIFYCK